jgi:DNA-binding transcriptional MerR regulator/effector-binding domain-containing protein
MLKISEFSKVTKISPRMLRHYDKLKLLQPLIVDQENGYRYYAPDQIAVANKIASLKKIGIPLKDIQQILTGKLDRLEYLDLHKQILERELAEKKLQLAYLRYFEEQDTGFHYPVEIKTMPTYEVLSLKKTVTDYYQEASLWEELFQPVQEQHIKELGPSVTRFARTAAGWLELEVMIAIPKRLQPIYTQTVSFAGGLVASTIINGAYESMTELHSHMENWLDINQYTLADNIFNIYHSSPATEEKEAFYITEVCYPIK